MRYTKRFKLDSKVAVLYSPGFGAGWASWNGDFAELFMFCEPIARLIHNGKPITEETALSLLITESGGLIDEDTYTYLGGLPLKIAWVDEHELVRITEYDGSEGVELNHGAGWFST